MGTITAVLLRVRGLRSSSVRLKCSAVNSAACAGVTRWAAQTAACGGGWSRCSLRRRQRSELRLASCNLLLCSAMRASAAKRSVIPLEAGDLDQWPEGTVDQARALVKLPPVEEFDVGPGACV